MFLYLCDTQAEALQLHFILPVVLCQVLPIRDDGGHSELGKGHAPSRLLAAVSTTPGGLFSRAAAIPSRTQAKSSSDLFQSLQGLASLGPSPECQHQPADPSSPGI